MLEGDGQIPENEYQDNGHFHRSLRGQVRGKSMLFSVYLKESVSYRNLPKKYGGFQGVTKNIISCGRTALLVAAVTISIIGQTLSRNAEQSFVEEVEGLIFLDSLKQDGNVVVASSEGYHPDLDSGQ